MELDQQVFAIAVKKRDGLALLRQAGVLADDFLDEQSRKAWQYVLRTKRDYGAPPSSDLLISRYPHLDPLPNVKSRDVALIVHNIKERKKFSDFVQALDDASQQLHSHEDVNEAMQYLQGRLNALYQRGGSAHLRDLFSEEVSEIMRTELEAAREGRSLGIPTGLKRFDRATGGLHPRRMVVIIGRPGLGKSWLDLLFVSSAVLAGKKVLLYPLEMTMAETAFRLYTIFAYKLYGAEFAMRHVDLSRGRISPRKFDKLVSKLEESYKGQLLVADMGSISDPYTNERIEAEVEMHRPDMFWVDYITLLKPSTGADEKEYSKVRSLSSGIKGISMRHGTVGGCSAQVNREAMRQKVFLPRLEHISYGDSIGQDADQVVSIDRDKDTPNALYYALIKNRNGMEIGKTKVTFHVDEGRIEEAPRQDDDNADD